MVPRAETLGAVFRPASERGAGWEIAAAGGVRAVLWLIVPVLLLQVFDRAIPSARAGDLIPLAAALVVVLAARSGLDLAAAAMAGTWRKVRLRNAVWGSISNLLSGRADAAPPLPGLDTGGPGISHGAVLAGLPVLAGVLIYLCGVMAAPAVGLALAAAAGAYFVHRGSPEPAAGAPSEITGRILDAIWTIKAMGAERLAMRLAEDAGGQAVAGQRRAVRHLLASDRMAVLFNRCTLVLAVVLGTVLALNGLMTLGQLVAGVLISVVLVRDAYRGASAWAIARQQGAFEQSTVLGTDPQPQEPLPRVTGNLMCNRVTLEEPADGMRAVARILFDRIRIEIDAGEAVLIKGGDAHMQSALLRLMAGLETPQSGTMCVDGYDLADFRPDSIRKQVAYVPSLGDVVPGTLMENLTAFDPGRAADAMGAARLTGLDGKAACLTDGFDTRLEEGAPIFPAGFRQHLAITRALAFKPRVLLLDHATENLDSQDLRAFSEVLERLKGRVTIVLASTQAGLRAMADREIDLDALTPAPEIGPALEDDEPSQDQEQGSASNATKDSRTDGGTPPVGGG
ncbi:MAG: ATP-binding cassette domain-containing protein [Rhodospirillales bacterium]